MSRAEPGWAGDEATTSSGESSVESVSSKSVKLKTALKEALVLGLSQRDNANLSVLLTEYLMDSISSDDDDDDDEQDDYTDFPEPEPMDIDDRPTEAEDVEEETDGAGDNNHEDEEEADEDNADDDGAYGLVPDLAQQIINIEGTDDWTSPDNDEEFAKVNNFSNCTCPRNRNRNNPCTNQFEQSYIVQLRAQMSDAEMSRRERKMFLMGRISSTMKTTKKTLCSKRARQTDRTRSRVSYLVEGTHVCRKSFIFMHNIGNDQLSGIIRHYEKNGAVPPTMKAGGRKYNTSSLTDKDITRVVTFVVNYAERNGMVIPGRIPGVKCADPRVRLLPSRDNKSSIWHQYKSQLESTNADHRVAGEPEHRVVTRSTFTKLWKQYTPFVIATKPMSDLCWHCQRNNGAVYLSANLPEAQKLQRLERQAEHLRLVSMERDLYRSMVEDAKGEVTEGLVMIIPEKSSPS